jgi:hypothetical protein
MGNTLGSQRLLPVDRTEMHGRTPNLEPRTPNSKLLLAVAEIEVGIALQRAFVLIEKTHRFRGLQAI